MDDGLLQEHGAGLLHVVGASMKGRVQGIYRPFFQVFPMLCPWNRRGVFSLEFFLGIEAYARGRRGEQRLKKFA